MEISSEVRTSVVSTVRIFSAIAMCSLCPATASANDTIQPFTFGAFPYFSQQQNLPIQSTSISRLDKNVALSLLSGKAFRFSVARGTEFRVDDKGYGISYTSKKVIAGMERRGTNRKTNVTNLSVGATHNLGSSRLTFQGLFSQDAQGVLNKEGFLFTGKRLTLGIQRTSVGKSFNSESQVSGLSAEAQALVKKERGFNRTDFNLQYTGVEGLKLLAEHYVSKGNSSSSEREGRKELAEYSFSPRNNFSFLHESEASINGEVTTTKSEHQRVQFNDQTRMAKLSLTHDSVSFANNGSEKTTNTDSIQFELKGSLPFKAFAERKSVSGAGPNENINTINIDANPSKSLCFNAQHTSVDRNKDESYKFSSLNFRFSKDERLQLTGVLSNKDSNSRNDNRLQQINISAVPHKGGSFNMLLKNSKTGESSKQNLLDVSYNTTEAISLGSASKVSINARFMELNTSDGSDSKIASITANGNLYRAQFSAVYVSSSTPVEGRKSSQSITLSQASKEKDKWKASFSLTERQYQKGESPTSVDSSLNYRLNSSSAVHFRYATSPEDAKKNILPQQITEIGLTTSHDELNYGISVLNQEDLRSNKESTRFQINVNGKCTNKAILKVNAGILIDQSAGNFRRYTPTLDLALDRAISGNNNVKAKLKWENNNAFFDLTAKQLF
ncbi:MAG: hypothetical protein GYA55_13460 [SAR324 cluster bacterium]|uniref:Uncharacterized protein n=1 Tax=SAR324 cluster bacterium TaxID=2024889 RepID=A0A7X9FUK3_9DELT|nr:hypothetical protein [SAR324 cluster bacterium]